MGKKTKNGDLYHNLRQLWKEANPQSSGNKFIYNKIVNKLELNVNGYVVI